MKRKFVVEHVKFTHADGLKSEYVGEVFLDTKTDDIYNIDNVLVQRTKDLLYRTKRSLFDWCVDADNLIDRLDGFNTSEYAIKRIIDFVKYHNARIFVQYKSDEQMYKDFKNGLGANRFVNMFGWGLINVYEIQQTVNEEECDKMDILIHEIRELKKEVVKNRKEISDLKNKICMYHGASLM